jgi:hypothetical protein
MISRGEGPEPMLDNESVHRKRRQLVFETIVRVLKDEQEEWTGANSSADAGKIFTGAWGVRFAGEVAIGYLAVKRLMTRGRLLGDAVVAPEHACKGGRMDLWIGDKMKTPGLAIELKYLMGPREARTVRRQAVRLCGAEYVTSAGFILWGHSKEDSDWSFDQLFADQLSGWTPWILESKEGVPAPWREHDTLNVWLFGADRRS